jgi:hypothetical protein
MHLHIVLMEIFVVLFLIWYMLNKLEQIQSFQTDVGLE